jgi:cobalt/nickel transport system ATP-binding protein
VHHSIEVSQLTFSYPDGHPALRGVSFSIAPGEKVALVGPNGAGKSTLLLHLNGILRGQGSIAVCGHQLFSLTVFDDVAFGPIYQGLPEAEVRGRVELALAEVGMADRAARVSHHLSGGEKKRIAIATVLSMEPEILALDEPTSGLDPRARRGLIRLLGELPMTMLVSTHDLRMVRELLPRTIILDGGLIVADGPTAELLSDPDLLQAHGLEMP